MDSPPPRKSAAGLPEIQGRFHPGRKKLDRIRQDPGGADIECAESPRSLVPGNQELDRIRHLACELLSFAE